MQNGLGSASSQYVFVNKALSHWLDSSGNSMVIFNDLGYVGIHTINPLGYLHINVSAIADSKVGSLMIGGGLFDGSTHAFAGSASGTQFAVNKTSGSTSDFANWQTYGVQKFLVDYVGNLTIAGDIKVGNTTTSPSTSATPVFTSYYGGNTKALGDPVAWMPLTIGATTYKIPLYT